MKYFLRITLCLLSLSALAQTPYTNYFTGDTTNVDKTTEYKICLMGGATEDDNAMKWFLNGSGGGDVVVIRVTGTNGYNNYLFSGLGITLNSVETIVIPSVAAANHPYVRRRIREAEALFIAGGNQNDYINFWNNTSVDTAINYLINVKKVPIGGTSAGMAVQGQAYYSAALGSITSTVALSNPYGNLVTIGNNNFLMHKLLRRTITDTHYDNPDRRGRQTTFLARLFQDSLVSFYGIACDEYTAVCIDSTGIAKVFGGFPTYDDNAYFIQPNCVLPNAPETCTANVPLTWNRNNQALKVYAIKGTSVAANSFNVKNWSNPSAQGGTWQDWYVVNGVISYSNNTQAIGCVTTFINERKEANAISFFPNPVSEKLFLEKEITLISLTDVNGKIINVQQSLATINTKELVDGIYIIKLEKNNKFFYSKLVVQH